MQKKIDDDFCVDERSYGCDYDEKFYNYSDRNSSTAHLHMMLSHALTQMIDSAECFIFLKSSNSYTLEDTQNGTFSPWIFHELATVNTIKRNRNRISLPSDESLVEKDVSQPLLESVQNKLKVFYPVELKCGYLLTKECLVEWKKAFSQKLPKTSPEYPTWLQMEKTAELCKK